MEKSTNTGLKKKKEKKEENAENENVDIPTLKLNGYFIDNSISNHITGLKLVNRPTPNSY